MVDVFPIKKRSEIMSHVKSRCNVATELRIIGIFRQNHITGWRRNARLFGNPDFVFPKAKVAVFVDGCFWHCCPLHGSIPKSNREFWAKKLSRNKIRDTLVNKRLRDTGWKTIRVWQHDLMAPTRVAERLSKVL